jgi:hypothetical protein
MIAVVGALAMVAPAHGHLSETEVQSSSFADVMNYKDVLLLQKVLFFLLDSRYTRLFGWVFFFWQKKQLLPRSRDSPS